MAPGLHFSADLFFGKAPAAGSPRKKTSMD